MARFIPMLGDRKAKKALDEMQEGIAFRRARLAVIQQRLSECFHDDGGIKLTGLRLELMELDEKRRDRNMDPTDSNAQLLIQGQQNEVVKLIEMRESLATEQARLMDDIAQAEHEANELASRLNRRSGNA